MIMDWCNSKGFRVTLAFAMTLSMLLVPFGHSASHDPTALAVAEVERHAALADEDNDYGHGHDDGWPEERDASHSHGHDPADHSHDLPVPADFGGHAFLLVGGSRHVAASFSHNRGPTFGIERPPRS